MKVNVYVTLKPGVLDPQGKAIHHALEGLGFGGVSDVRAGRFIELDVADRSEEHTSELQSLMRISYAVFCLKKKKTHHKTTKITVINNKKHRMTTNTHTTQSHTDTIARNSNDIT